jgi:FkbM family methyltransferase
LVKHLKGMMRAVVPPRLWTALRLARLNHSIRSYAARQVRHTYGGFTLDVWLSDPLAAGWYDHDWDEMPEISLLRGRRLRTGARVFDLGAHQGIVALVLAKVVGPTGAVVAVEANRHNAEAARRNRAINHLRQLTIVEAAVADAPGTIVFGEGLNGQVDDGTGSWGRREVPAVSVDGLAREYGPPDVLFIDVEGYECQVLRGARETLVRRPDCFVEVHVGEGLERLGGSVDDVLSHFPDAAYDKYVWTELSPEPVPFAAGSAMMRGRFFLVAFSRVADVERFAPGNGN